MHSKNHVRGGNLRPEAKLGHRTDAVRPSAYSLVRNTRAMTLPTMLAHERVVGVRAVTFVLVERGYGGARMSCGTAPSFQQTEQLVKGLNEGTLAGLDNLVAWLPGAFLFKRASTVLQSSSMASSASSLSTTGRSD